MDASISGFITLTILGVLKKKKEMNNKKKKTKFISIRTLHLANKSDVMIH